MSAIARTRRFFSYVTFPSVGDCWLWSGTVNYKGYGGFDGKCAHRFSYRLFKGPIADGLEIDHICRVKHCVNPRHLEAVTGAENKRRRTLWWTSNGTCRRGHRITPENIYTFMNRGVIERTCLRCRMMSRRRWIARQATAGSLPVHSLSLRSAGTTSPPAYRSPESPQPRQPRAAQAVGESGHHAGLAAIGLESRER
jgi:hypothetical protein